MDELSELPGNDLVVQGVRDLRAGIDTPAALLVAMARQRLREVGLDVPPRPGGRPSHELYDQLVVEGADSAHTRYNALVRRLVSFARAAEHATPR